MNYYAFHIGDYSSRTMHLDPMEDIAYRRMLDLYYLQEAPLPPDVSRIARLIRMREHEEIIRSVLQEFFDECEDGWHHVRCIEEIAAASDKRTKAQASARASVEARRAKASAPLSDRSTDAQRTLSERSAPNPNPNPNPKENIKPSARRSQNEELPLFNKFWGEYPNKVGKAKALAAFAKIDPSEELLASMIQSVRAWRASQAWTKDGGQFIPHASTWLNGRRWEDPPPAAATLASPQSFGTTGYGSGGKL